MDEGGRMTLGKVQERNILGMPDGRLMDHSVCILINAQVNCTLTLQP